MKEVTKEEVQGAGLPAGGHRDCPGCAPPLQGPQENSERRRADRPRRFEMSRRVLRLTQLLLSVTWSSNSDNDASDQQHARDNGEREPDVHTEYNSPRGR